MCDDSKVQEECDQKAAKCIEDLKDDVKGYRCVCEDGFEEDSGVCKSK